MENNRPTITIKLKRHLQEFVLSELGNSGSSSDRNLIGKVLRPFIEVRPKYIDPDFCNGPEYITFPLPLYNNFNLRSNYYITHRNQKIIENFLELHFKEMFYQYMKDKVRFYRSFKNCILQFCSDHNFTFSSINFEMLKKYYYRRSKADHTQGVSDNKMLSRNVPAMSLACPYLKSFPTFTFLNSNHDH